MGNNKAPQITEIGLLPNMFLKITFADETVRYWRSEINQEEINMFKQGKKNLFGFTRLTPEFYWIGNDISIGDDNQFKVNNVSYDGNQIYYQGLDSY